MAGDQPDGGDGGNGGNGGGGGDGGGGGGGDGGGGGVSPGGGGFPAGSAGFPPGEDVVALLNAHLGGFERAIGLQFTRVSRDEVVAEVPVAPVLLQPYGIVHGGVYASIVETLASAGAALFAMAGGKSSVGLENTTSFVRAVRSGKLVGVATPVHRGRTSQVWEVRISDEDGKLAATGRVRTMTLDPGAAVAGEVVRVKT